MLGYKKEKWKEKGRIRLLIGKIKTIRRKGVKGRDLKIKKGKEGKGYMRK
jgi:hypothetical protein